IVPLTGLKGGILHPTRALSRSRYNNFQPRVGLAYNFAKNWVFRAGFAINTMDLWTASLQENFEEYLATTTVQRPTGDPATAFTFRRGRRPSASILCRTELPHSSGPTSAAGMPLITILICGCLTS